MTMRSRVRAALRITFLAALAACAGSAPTEVPPGDDPDPVDPNQVCATGCSAAPNGGSELSAERFLELLDSLEGSVEAFDELLFHGEQSRHWLEELGTGTLGAEAEQRLRRELARDRVRFDARIVRDDGEELMRIGERSIPIGKKQHIWPERAIAMVPPEVSGTVQRVGERHLWARL